MFALASVGKQAAHVVQPGASGTAPGHVGWMTNDAARLLNTRMNASFLPSFLSAAVFAARASASVSGK